MTPRLKKMMESDEHTLIFLHYGSLLPIYNVAEDPRVKSIRLLSLNPL